MPYQFRQTGAEIQDILDQVGENTTDISSINTTLTNMSTTYTYSATDSTTGLTIKARKRGGILSIQLSGSANVPNSWTVIGTLPANLRPSVNTDYTTLVSQSNATSAKLLLSVYPNGQVRVNASGGAISGVYFNDSATFVAD